MAWLFVNIRPLKQWKFAQKHNYFLQNFARYFVTKIYTNGQRDQLRKKKNELDWQSKRKRGSPNIETRVFKMAISMRSGLIERVYISIASGRTEFYELHFCFFHAYRLASFCPTSNSRKIFKRVARQFWGSKKKFSPT